MKKIKTAKATNTIRYFAIILAYLFCTISSIALDIDSLYNELDKIYGSGQFGTSLTDSYNENKILGNKIKDLFCVYNIADKTDNFDLHKKCAVYLIRPTFSTGDENVFFLIADNVVKIFVQDGKSTRDVLREIYTMKKEHPKYFSKEHLTNCVEYVIYNRGYERTRMKLNSVKYSSGSFEYYYYPKIPAKELALGFNELIQYYKSKDKYNRSETNLTNDKTAETDFVIEDLLLNKTSNRFENVDMVKGIYCITQKDDEESDKYLMICQNNTLKIFNLSYSKETAYNAVSYLISLMYRNTILVSNDQFKQIISRIVEKDKYSEFKQFSIFQLQEIE